MKTLRRGLPPRSGQALAVVLCLILGAQVPAVAYLELSARTLRGDAVTLRWDDMPARYFVTERGVPGVPAAEVRAAIERAFATWEAVPSASITFQSQGFTRAEPFEDDDRSVLGFQNEPEMERTLGATGFVIDAFTGEIIESDVFFNSAFPWSTSAAGEAGRFDLESVALHEIGHFLGLGHSALGETELMAGDRRRVTATGAVMFPISFGSGSTQDRVLQADDIAGASDIYPAAGHRDATGAARGRVTKNGQAVQGAHVVAFNPETRDLIAGFTVNTDGEFEITGLTPGPHVIRVEPIDDADVESFFSARNIDVSFQVTFHTRLFVAPPGGVGERFEVSVRPK